MTINLTGGTINTGTGTLNLAGNLNYDRSIWPATIQGNLSLGSAAGEVSVNQGSSTDLTIAANISGSPTGGLVKTGNGLLTLTGSNAYAGGTTISGGALAGRTTGPVCLPATVSPSTAECCKASAPCPSRDRSIRRTRACNGQATAAASQPVAVP